MKKIQIYYFSGTGNTALIINKLSEYLRELGNKVTTESCENVKEINFDFDILGIAFPIHSSYTPKIFRDLIQRLPVVNSIPIFGIVTAGYTAGDVIGYELREINKKGYIPLLYENVVVGNNLYLPRLCPLKVTSQEKLEKRLVKIDKKLKGTAVKINSEIKSLKGNGPLGKIFGGVQRPSGKIHEAINFKGFYADEKCINCNWCITNCPTNNIEVKEGKITFKDNCLICMRCYSFCPRKAIQTAKRTKNSKYTRYAGPLGLGMKTKFR